MNFDGFFQRYGAETTSEKVSVHTKNSKPDKIHERSMELELELPHVEGIKANRKRYRGK